MENPENNQVNPAYESWKADRKAWEAEVEWQARQPNRRPAWARTDLWHIIEMIAFFIAITALFACP